MEPEVKFLEPSQPASVEPVVTAPSVLPDELTSSLSFFSLSDIHDLIQRLCASISPSSSFPELSACYERLVACEKELRVRLPADELVLPPFQTLQTIRRSLKLRIQDMFPGPHRYELGRTLHNTRCGKLKIGQHKYSGRPVAIKVSDLARVEGHENPAEEARLLRGLSRFPHPNVISLLDEFQCQETRGNRTRSLHYMVTELCTGGDLFSVAMETGVDMAGAQALFRQLMQGVRHLHSRRIAHLDLSVENCVLDAQGVLKIIDFGLAREVPLDSPPLQGRVGKLHYMAPEVFAGVPYDGMAADIYSCGIILFVLLARGYPYEDVTDNNGRRLRKGFIRQLLAVQGLEDRVPFLASELISAMTGLPHERLTAEQVLQHPWLK